MEIRSMTAEDIPQVVEIEQNSFSQPWSAKGFSDSLGLKDTLFLVAEESVANSCGQVCKVILGYIGMYISFDEGEITNVAVGTAARRLGTGRRLVCAMKSAATERGVGRIVLEVRVSNAAAISLYEKEGFRRLGVRKNFYEFPREDAYIMEVNLC